MSSITRAEFIEIGEYPPGGDSDILVAMTPVEDTAGWAITADFSATRLGTPILTLTTGDGEIDVGEGDDGEIIRLKMVHADTSALSGQHWLHVRRTDSGSRDRLVIGRINFKGPGV